MNYVIFCEEYFLSETFSSKKHIPRDTSKKLIFTPFEPPKKGKRTSDEGKLSRLALPGYSDTNATKFTHFAIF